MSDAAGGTDTAIVSIAITPVNDNPPVGNDDSATVVEGGTVTTLVGGAISVLNNDTDPDLPNDTLTVDTTPASGPTHGSLTLNSNGTFSYTHNGSENFTDSFTYEVSDASGVADTAAVSITVTPVNDNPPVGNGESATVAEGGTVTALVGGATSVLDNDTDVDLPNDTLTVDTTPVSGPTHGSLTLSSDGTFSYTHNGSENFSDSFTYEVSDAAGGADTAIMSIAVTPVNDNNPVGNNDSATVAEGGTVTTLDGGATSALDNDTDVDLPNDTLTVDTTPASGPTHGSLTLNSNGTFSYTHNGSENLADSFSYEISDAAGATDTATVSIIVTPVNNNAPAANGENATVPEGGTVTALVGGATSVLANDTDADLPGDTLTAVLEVGPTHATSFTLNPNGTFSYQHDSSENFSDSFIYHAHDGVNDSNAVTVSIAITPVNDNAPVANGESATVAEGSTVTVLVGGVTSVLANDTDTDLPNDTLTVNTAPTSGPNNGTLTLNADGTFSYTHNDSENFSDNFTYEVSDAAGVTDTATVAITVTPVNDNAPVANTESATVTEGGTVTVLNSGASSLLANDTDTDLPNDTLTVNTTSVSGPSNGTLTLNTNGTFSYTHDDSENFSDSFTYEVSDDAGATSTATVSIVVTPVNDNAPVANDESATVAEGGTVTVLDSGATSLLANDTDTDLPNDTLTVNTTPVSGPSNGTLTLNSSGTFSYTHNGSGNFTDSFSYEVSDDAGATNTATVSITITPVNDNDPVGNDDSATVAEGGTVTALVGGATSVLANDADADLPNDTLTVNTTPINAPSNGTLTLNADGTFSYTHDDSENHTDGFTYEVSDTAGGTDTATVSITITPVNDNSPVGTVDSATVAEGGTVTTLNSGATSVLANDTDGDLPGDTLTAVLDVAPAHAASFTLNSDGTFSYQHDDSENFTASFTYHVHDGANNSGTVTVSITITPVNDNAPVATDDAYSVDEDNTLTVNGVLDDDNDVDGDTLTANLVNDVSNGTLTLNTDGSFSYTPVPAFNGTDTFTYQANDGTTNSNVATATITVNPINDAPTVDAVASATIPEDASVQTVSLSGIGLGAANEGNQTLTVTASSSNTALIPDPTVTYTSPNATGTLSYIPAANANGTATITVAAQDDGGTANGGDDSFQTTFIVTVTPVNDAPTAIDLDNTSVDENQPVGTLVGTFTAVDPDVGDSHTFSLVPGEGDTDNALFSFGSPELKTNVPFDFETGNSFSIRVQASDGNGGTIQAAIIINVIDVNEAPHGHRPVECNYR